MNPRLFSARHRWRQLIANFRWIVMRLSGAVLTGRGFADGAEKTGVRTTAEIVDVHIDASVGLTVRKTFDSFFVILHHIPLREFRPGDKAQFSNLARRQRLKPTWQKVFANNIL